MAERENREGPAGGTPDGQAAFTRVIQIGMVVSDLAAAVQGWLDRGVGPWTTFEIGPDRVPDLDMEGGPWRATSRVAIATLGGVQLELIEPVGEEGLYARFLADRGPGLHHVALGVQDFDAALAREAERGVAMPVNGTVDGIRLAYFDLGQTLGALIETSDLQPNDPRLKL